MSTSAARMPNALAIAPNNHNAGITACRYVEGHPWKRLLRRPEPDQAGANTHDVEEVHSACCSSCCMLVNS